MQVAVDAAVARKALAKATTTKTDKQRDACIMMRDTDHTMLFGGSRSGKTFIILRQIVLRALKKPSRHLIARHRFSHIKKSVVNGTMKDVMRECFPGITFKYNAIDAFYEIPVPNTHPQEYSYITVTGIDSKDRVEAILGNEYSSIYLNECSQIAWEGVTTLWTRLAETSGLSLRMYYDCNPPNKSHWAYSLFIKNVLPDGTPWDMQHDSMLMNPVHNLDNLPPTYLATLKALPKRQRQRFLEGLFLDTAEDALWSDMDIANARTKKPGEIVRTIVAIDPSVSNKETSDECGIVVVSLDEDGEGIVEADYSGKMSTSAWALLAVELYDAFDANCIVAESNQGGTLISDALKACPGGRDVKVELVHASRGKAARAEPVQMLYEQGRVSHTQEFPELEDEMTGWEPTKSLVSPNRLDALVWGLTHLMLKDDRVRVHIGEAF